MAKNTGDGYRKGAITGRTQTFNEKTQMFIKRDETGKFMAAKSSAFKNVTRETSAKKK